MSIKIVDGNLCLVKQFLIKSLTPTHASIIDENSS
jgi:hypothetical protein